MLCQRCNKFGDQVDESLFTVIVYQEPLHLHRFSRLLCSDCFDPIQTILTTVKG